MVIIKNFNALKNENLKITYLNLIILTLIISTLVNALLFNVFKLYPTGYILILLPFLLGGILAGLILDKNKRIIGGLLVGAVAAPFSLSIYGVLNQVIAGVQSEVGYAFYYILFIPIFLIVGGVMGVIGSLLVAGLKKN